MGITRPASRQFCAKHCPLAPDGLKEDAKVETGAKNTSPEDGLQKTVKLYASTITEGGQGNQDEVKKILQSG